MNVMKTPHIHLIHWYHNIIPWRCQFILTTTGVVLLCTIIYLVKSMTYQAWKFSTINHLKYFSTKWSNFINGCFLSTSLKKTLRLCPNANFRSISLAASWYAFLIYFHFSYSACLRSSTIYTIWVHFLCAEMCWDVVVSSRSCLIYAWILFRFTSDGFALYPLDDPKYLFPAAVPAPLGAAVPTFDCIATRWSSFSSITDLSSLSRNVTLVLPFFSVIDLSDSAITFTPDDYKFPLIDTSAMTGFLPPPTSSEPFHILTLRFLLSPPCTQYHRYSCHGNECCCLISTYRYRSRAWVPNSWSWYHSGPVRSQYSSYSYNS